MSQNDIQSKLEQAINQLFTNQADLFRFTSATNQTEWNINHHLANEIGEVFSDYHCDVDVAKPDMNRMRPDIIIHERGTHDRNLLIVEIKRREADIPGELEKIQRYWFQAPLSYRYGAVIVINEDGWKLEILSRD
ncbi:MAG: hypothetical protein HWE25_09405 [Alphaproteobacteria bacterium]|nr:hypothetical protein [Alphaproteobacteria bacterium]